MKASGPGGQPSALPSRRRFAGFQLMTGGAVVALVLIVLLVVAAVLVANAVHSSRHKSAPTTQKGVLYRVGQTATTSGLEVTVASFKDPQPPTAQIRAAPEGQHLVSVNLKMRNPGSEKRVFSPVFLSGLSDSRNRSYSVQIDAAAFRTTQIAPGATIHTSLVFAVPNGTTGLVFYVRGSITAAGSEFSLTATPT